MNQTDVIRKIMDSKDTTVGGGSASAIAGAMAAGLIGMVSRLSVDKDLGLSNERYLQIADETDELSQALLKGAKADTEAYLKMKSAYGLPKGTAIEKGTRKDAIQVGAIQAANVPKLNGYLCKRLHDFGILLQDKSNPAALSDLLTGIYLAHVGVQGCVMNIEANLPVIKDEVLKAEFEEHIRALKMMK